MRTHTMPISRAAIRRLLTGLATGAFVAVTAAGCKSVLDANPVDKLPDDQAITNAAGARAALAGAYDGLQNLSYYGGDFLFLNDLYGDNSIHSGTFNTFAEAERHSLRADNVTIEGIWDAVYATVNRVNRIIQAVPGLTDLDPVEQNQILGEAYALRALTYHDLVKLWGDVPLRLDPPTSPDEAAQIARSPVATVYDQIVADLQQAEGLVTSNSPTNHITLGAVKALLARVYLYRADYVNANLKANEVIGMGYDLAPAFGDLFDAEGQDTPEDIFKVTFTAEDFQDLGYYYLSYDNGGRSEVSPSPDLIAAFEPGDARFSWDINLATTPPEGTKYPTPIGAEDFHVIRLAEVILIKSEALAQQGNLDSAVAEYNKLRVRAGLAPHVLGVDVTTQQQVLDAIDHERRIELCMEGDRFPDLVRTGRAETKLGIQPYQLLYPIPQQETDVSPNIQQNPGY